MLANKRRRLDDGGDESEEEVEVVRSVGVVPTGPRGGAPMGPRAVGVGVRDGRNWVPRVPDDLFVRRAYRFVDRRLLGTRNAMVGDTYHTRGGSARAQRSREGFCGGRGNRPYR